MLSVMRVHFFFFFSTICLTRIPHCIRELCLGCLLVALKSVFSSHCDLCTLCVFQLLTNHYEQNWKYYCLPSGWGSYGTASEDELLLTKKIFWGVFDSLSQRVRLLGVFSSCCFKLAATLDDFSKM